MEERQVTIKELVEMTIDELKNLSIPAYMLDQFGPPISRALHNLHIMNDAMANIEQQEQAQTNSKEPVIENME